jgi:tetratricopeptide (TPR) repeat protein
MRYFVSLTVCLLTLLTVTYAQSLRGNQLKDSLKQALAGSKEDTLRARTLFRLGSAYVGNDSAAAVKYAEEGRKLSAQLGWQKGAGHYYLILTKLCRNAADNDGCIRNARAAYLVFSMTDDKKDAAAALVYMGNSYEATGFYAKSIESNLAALPIYESLADSHGIGVCLINLGVDYFYLRQYDKAIEYYQKSLVLKRREGDQFGIGSAVDNIAMIYLDQGKYDSADVYNKEGIAMFEAAGDSAGLGRIYSNRANILLKKKDAMGGVEYNRRSLAIDKQRGFDDGVSYAYGYFGELYLVMAKDGSDKYRVAPWMKRDKKGLLDSAAYYLDTALGWARKAEDLNLLMSLNQTLAETEELRGNYGQALKAHKDYTLYKDSIFNDENKQKIAALENERLTQVKDREIALQAAEARRQALLKRFVTITAVAVVALIGVFVWVYNRRKKARFDKNVMEVEMKALRAQMNPHFISNALHSINKYVMENDKMNASGYLAKFASLMRLILENSREQEVPLEQDLRALELYLQMELLRFNNSFSYQIEIDEQIDVENTMVPPMLLQPFAENAILHGLQNKKDGVVSIRVRKSDDMICCVIEDNGNGQLDGGVAKPGEAKTHKSLGRKIIQERLTIINRLKKAKATVNIHQLKDSQDRPGGVRVELFLPVELAF